MREQLRALHETAALQRQLLEQAERVAADARAAVAAASEAASAYDERDDSEAAANALRAGQAFTGLRQASRQ